MLKNMVKMHVIAALATTVLYAWMTRGDWTHILAMVALYEWMLTTTMIVQGAWQDKAKKDRRRRYEDRTRDQRRAV